MSRIPKSKVQEKQISKEQRSEKSYLNILRGVSGSIRTGGEAHTRVDFARDHEMVQYLQQNR